MKVAWLSDIHLNFLGSADLQWFGASLSEIEADVFVISGDIAEGDTLKRYLDLLDRSVKKPLYFVNGNHDGYGTDSETLRRRELEWCKDYKYVRWLPNEGVVPLTAKTALVGWDGWYDCGYGYYWYTFPNGQRFEMLDFRRHGDLKDLGLNERLERCQALGREAANHVLEWVPKALAQYSHVLYLTHVPPFQQASLYMGHPSPVYSVPFFACKATAEAFLQVMEGQQDKALTVLAGHTHDAAEFQPWPNLHVWVAKAEYGYPEVYKVFEVE